MLLHCYLCHAEFEAAAQARYCSSRCRRRMEYLRARRRELRVHIAARHRELLEARREGRDDLHARWHLEHAERRLSMMDRETPE